MFTDYESGNITGKLAMT